MINFYRCYSRRDQLDHYAEYDKKVQHAKWMHFDRDDMSQIEHIIAKENYIAIRYILDVVKGRWTKGEPYFVKNANVAVFYARDILKQRWLEAEPYIMKDPLSAYGYARDILKDRWPEAEPYIKLHPQSAVSYSRAILSRAYKEGNWPHKYGKWPEAEPLIKKYDHWWDDYCNGWSYEPLIKLKE
jgi:hypothetical protein